MVEGTGSGVPRYPIFGTVDQTGPENGTRARPGREGGRALIVHASEGQAPGLASRFRGREHDEPTRLPSNEGCEDGLRDACLERERSRLVWTSWAESGQLTPTMGSRRAPGASSGTTGEVGDTGAIRS